jgi:gamma-glutamylcyclotransferase (GGCT)/AIG2-like uncharacterized protein YtfP
MVNNCLCGPGCNRLRLSAGSAAARWFFATRAYIVTPGYLYQVVEMKNTFVYGSLMFGAVWDALIKNRYPRTAARLDGYARVCVKGEVYPALVEAEGGAVDGVLVSGVSALDISVLDRFEGSCYSRVPVTVTTSQGDCKADTYLFSGETRLLMADSEWNADEFRESGIKVFLAGYRGFR